MTDVCADRIGKVNPWVCIREPGHPGLHIDAHDNGWSYPVEERTERASND